MRSEVPAMIAIAQSTTVKTVDFHSYEHMHIEDADIEREKDAKHW